MKNIEEYKILRDEMLYYMKSRDQVTMFFMTSAFVLLGYDFWSDGANEWFLFIPIFISLFAIIFHSIRSLYILKIDSYIRVFLEKDSEDFNWHERKYKYKLGKIYSISHASISILFLAPIIVSFIKLFIIDINYSNIISLFVVTTIIVLVKIQKNISIKKIDSGWGKVK